jgi:hypothetical protein
MDKFFDEFKTWAFKFKKNTARSIRAIITEEQAIDWNGIDETRSRLHQMRFRPCHCPQSNLSFAPSSGELGSTFRIDTRSREKELMNRWFAGNDPLVNARDLEKSLRETIYNRKTETVIDHDWTFRQTKEYESLLLPNVNYDVNPSQAPRLQRRVAGLLTAAAH